MRAEVVARLFEVNPGWTTPWARHLYPAGMQDGRRRMPVGPLVIDTALACVMAVVTIVYARQGYADRYRSEGWPSFDCLAVALSLAANLPLAVRRPAPATAFCVSCGALVAYTAAGFQPSTNLWAPLLACYTVIVRHPMRRAAWVAVATAAAWGRAAWRPVCRSSWRWHRP
ncbi:hypothetical protein ACFQ3Z_43825 [Streptomyces nogalater]